ncbi:response regulator transcription factor [Caballeronia ptereochthonis]|uniref:Two component LuxR family transcriptional regulator n=1 Tax=Caballeronia ptereochthonis TaxID=1777144 RepID=A0A158DYR0_9BURK|nr:response regulator transcription factor [Caballeronia ptereochthonis]SAK99752.1 two component LuxR family transcriptional regulator [Caballeronia ptereochthonis]
MDIAILTPVRLFGDGLASFLTALQDIHVRATVRTFSMLRTLLADTPVDIALIDVTQGIDFDEVRDLASNRPSLTLLALGLTAAHQDVIRCGRAGFAGYVGRDASLDALLAAIRDAVSGRLVCPPEVAGELLRALYRGPPDASTDEADLALTKRECDVLRHVGHGLSNKEIARELGLSLSTIKHHVHSILDKLQVTRRAQAMRRVRDAPWIAGIAQQRGGAWNASRHPGAANSTSAAPAPDPRPAIDHFSADAAVRVGRG